MTDIKWDFLSRFRLCVYPGWSNWIVSLTTGLSAMMKSKLHLKKSLAICQSDIDWPVGTVNSEFFVRILFS